MTRSRSFAGRSAALPIPAARLARATALAKALATALAMVGVTLVPLAAAAGPRLLMLPIVVHSAEDPEYLRDGLSDMLASRFERLGSIELVRGKVDGRGTTDADEARALARKAGADYVLYGSFTRFGQGASLDVQCAPLGGGAEAEREPLREIFVHSGSIGEIIPDLDELAGKVTRFVRGEQVATGVPAALGGGGIGAPGAASADLQDLRARVEVLEATIRALVEDSGAADGSSGEELR